MSKERQRARAARDAEQRAAAARSAARGEDRAAAARLAARRAKASSRAQRRSAREPVYRLRRFPRLPWRLKAALALGWSAVAVAVLWFVPTWPGRLGLLVVATAALPLIVVLVRDPSRRTR